MNVEFLRVQALYDELFYLTSFFHFFAKVD